MWQPCRWRMLFLSVLLLAVTPLWSQPPQLSGANDPLTDASQILGFAEAYTQGYISTKWSDLLVFVILICFMLFRPQGLFGKADIRKV